MFRLKRQLARGRAASQASGPWADYGGRRRGCHVPGPALHRDRGWRGKAWRGKAWRGGAWDSDGWRGNTWRGGG